MDYFNKLFAGLTAEQLGETARIGELQTLKRGEVLFREGDDGDAMYLLLRGCVAIEKGAQSSGVQLLDTVLTGDYFGEMSLIDSGPRSAQATALEDAEVRILRRDDLDRLCAVSPQIMLNLLKGVSDRLRVMNNQFIDRIVHQEKLALVGQMASTIIHDFKSPMTVIRAAAQMITVKAQNEYVTKNTEIIIRNVDRITNMTNDLLQFSLGTVKLYCSWVDPEAWVDNLSELLSPILENRSIQLECEILTVEKLWMDPEKMMRVVYNLSTNAVEAMPTGGTLTVRVLRDGDTSQIDVADTGHGIPEAVRNRLFRAFVTYGKKNGTGLGTAIAKKIVDEHHGEISFTTETGRGTTFHVRLPVSIAPPVGSAPKRDINPKGPSRLGLSQESKQHSMAKETTTKSILVVDDDHDIVMVIEAFLKNAGYHVDVAYDGIEALTQIRSHSYETVVCDMNMPRMGGEELYSEVERTMPWMARRFLFVTGSVRLKDVSRFYSMSGTRALEKPFHAEDVLQIVSDIVVENT